MACARRRPDVGTEAQRESGKRLYLKILLPVPRRERERRRLRHAPSAPKAARLHHGQVQDPHDSQRSAPDPPGPRQHHQARHAVHLDAGLAQLSPTRKYRISPTSLRPSPPTSPIPRMSPSPFRSRARREPTNESIELGKKLYVDTGCVKCHGNLGRGDGPSAPTLKDDWGHPIRAANLAQSWTFRGGSSREDIFRTMSTGLNGTPMPSFLDALTPEQRWAITDFIVSLSGSNGPGYTNLVIAKHVQERIDLTKGAASFASAPVARFPIIGQIMEPGRAFHPPATSVTVQAIYDADSIALLVRWHDMSAQKTGKNGPSLPVPPEEEEEPRLARPPAKGGVFGEEEVVPARRQAQTPGASRRTPLPRRNRRPAGRPSEFSDAVSVQIPSQVPTGARKPYFIFGDAENSVDLWFFDLARPQSPSVHRQGKRGHRCQQRRGRSHRCRELRPGRMVGHLQAVPAPGVGRRVLARNVPAGRLLGLGRVLARAWQQARSHALVLPLRRARNGSLGRRPDGEDGARHSRHRAGRHRLGAVALRLSRPRRARRQPTTAGSHERVRSRLSGGSHVQEHLRSRR